MKVLPSYRDSKWDWNYYTVTIKDKIHFYYFSISGLTLTSKITFIARIEIHILLKMIIEISNLIFARKLKIYIQWRVPWKKKGQCPIQLTRTEFLWTVQIFNINDDVCRTKLKGLRICQWNRFLKKQTWNFWCLTLNGPFVGKPIIIMYECLFLMFKCVVYLIS